MNQYVKFKTVNMNLIWIIFIGVAIISYFIQYMLNKRFDEYSNIQLMNGMTGKDVAEKMLRDTVTGYTTVVPQKNNVSLSNQDSKYALYPVWILNTTYKGEKFIFAMNGQTGKFVGNLPIDWGAFWRWFLGLFAGFGAISLLIAKLIALL